MPQDIRIIRSADLPATPWRNGGGLTREVASASDDRGLLWRLSLAEVAAEGPFSAFEGLQRILTVTEGAGMRYHRGNRMIEAPLLVPVPLDGAPPVEGRLPHGPVRNVNLSYRPDTIRAEMAVLRGPMSLTLGAEHSVLALHAVTGEARIGDACLSAGSTALGARAKVVLDEGACVVAVTLAPVDDARGLARP